MNFALTLTTVLSILICTSAENSGSVMSESDFCVQCIEQNQVPVVPSGNSREGYRFDVKYFTEMCRTIPNLLGCIVNASDNGKLHCEDSSFNSFISAHEKFYTLFCQEDDYTDLIACLNNVDLQRNIEYYMNRLEGFRGQIVDSENPLTPEQRKEILCQYIENWEENVRWEIRNQAGRCNMDAEVKLLEMFRNQIDIDVKETFGGSCRPKNDYL